jgi:AcrR family transcriptional regulator
VLYHFPSRDALVAGMISALVERWNATFVADESDDDSPGAFTRRYVRDVFREYDQDGRENRLSVAVLAAAAADPALLEPLRSQSEAWQKRIENDGLDPIRAATIRLASDGWWLSKMFGLAHTPEMRRRIADDLIALATPDPAA